MATEVMAFLMAALTFHEGLAFHENLLHWFGAHVMAFMVSTTLSVAFHGFLNLRLHMWATGQRTLLVALMIMTTGLMTFHDGNSLITSCLELHPKWLWTLLLTKHIITTLCMANSELGHNELCRRGLEVFNPFMEAMRDVPLCETAASVDKHLHWTIANLAATTIGTALLVALDDASSLGKERCWKIHHLWWDLSVACEAKMDEPLKIQARPGMGVQIYGNVWQIKVVSSPNNIKAIQNPSSQLKWGGYLTRVQAGKGVGGYIKKCPEKKKMCPKLVTPKIPFTLAAILGHDGKGQLSWHAWSSPHILWHLMILKPSSHFLSRLGWLSCFPRFLCIRPYHFPPETTRLFSSYRLEKPAVLKERWLLLYGLKGSWNGA